MCNFSEVIEERGIAKGMEIGFAKGAIKNASRLVSKGKFTDEEIASVTVLTIERIIEIKAGKAS